MKMFRGHVRSLHFVGIGGSGMSSMAEILLELGFSVSGSDAKESSVLARLRELGAKTFVGHRAEQVEGADVVVHSTAINLDNVELVEARTRKIAVIPRAEMMAELMRLKYGIAVAGSHGKTTTTSLITSVLRHGGLDPSAIIGGRVRELGSGAVHGKGDVLVAEADESDGSFLRLSPTIALMTNIDPEHLDHYGDFEGLKRAFIDFANRVPFYGLVVACIDHPVVKTLLPQIDRRIVTYGVSTEADYQIVNVVVTGLQTQFEVVRKGSSLGNFTVAMPGEHNAFNATAAIAVADELDVNFAMVREALSAFSGVDRRFTVVGQVQGATVVDDYGHHPEEIKATLNTARSVFAGKVRVIFQPHRYTRTESLFVELAQALTLADRVIIVDIYPAGESSIEGITSVKLAEAVSKFGHADAHYASSFDDAAALALQGLSSGDAIITLGAGSITKLAPKLIT